MKFYQYQDDADLDNDWKFIFTIINPNGIVRERNPLRGRVETFDYDPDEYSDEEECLTVSYNSTLIYEGE